MTAFTPTHRSKVKRLHERGRYDEESVFAILDAGVVAHIGYVIDGQPYVTPTAYWRRGRTLYWHGSSASRMIRSQKEGVDVCLTVTHLDSLVMARSGFHHSVNYRAVMAFGKAHVIDDPDEKLKLMDRFIDRIYPGRSQLIRQPNKQEFKATTMIGMEIEAASGKIRDKHVADEEEDYEGVRAWSALYPITQVLGEPSDCARQLPGLTRPDEMSDFEPGVRFDELMTKSYKRTFG